LLPSRALLCALFCALRWGWPIAAPFAGAGQSRPARPHPVLRISPTPRRHPGHQVPGLSLLLLEFPAGQAAEPGVLSDDY